MEILLTSTRTAFEFQCMHACLLVYNKLKLLKLKNLMTFYFNSFLHFLLNHFECSLHPSTTDNTCCFMMHDASNALNLNMRKKYFEIKNERCITLN